MLWGCTEGRQGMGFNGRQLSLQDP